MKRFSLLIVLCFLVLNFYGQSVERWQGNLAVKDGWAPFEFSIELNPMVWKVTNGTETIVLDKIELKDDSIFVSVPAYDTQFRLAVKGDSMLGVFLKNYVENDKGVEFRAYKNRSRFEDVSDFKSKNIGGRWEINFDGDKEVNVGVFNKLGSVVTGSVLSNSGDMRFLEGVATEEGFVVSTFTGLSAYKLEVKVLNDTIWDGYYYSAKGKNHFTARYNPKASLENPFLLTKLLPGKSSLSFEMKDIDGNLIDIKSEKYKNKVVVVSILGSWCPNCLDEHAFLSEWHRNHPEVEIIGLAFERKDDPAYANKFLTNLKERVGIDYPLLFAGKVGVESTRKILPEIEQIKSYPTTIFIGKDGKVAKIHTGFSGPATGLFYEEFQKEFNEIVNSLLQN